MTITIVATSTSTFSMRAAHQLWQPTNALDSDSAELIMTVCDSM